MSLTEYINNVRANMNFYDVLTQCKNVGVGLAVIDALEKLFHADIQLLHINASEQAIAAKIAQYLAPHFDKFHVDVEYNRMGRIPKRVTWNDSPDEVYPDIIVHRRETPINILAIELKKDTNHETKSKDIKKLKAYQIELGYRHALFIRLGTNENAGSVCECEWVLSSM